MNNHRLKTLKSTYVDLTLQVRAIGAIYTLSTLHDRRPLTMFLSNL